MSEQKKVNRFVQPSVSRLELADGDWIEVKRELSIGEARAAMARTVKSMRADGRIEPDLEQVGRSEIAAYIVDWSFDDPNGRRVPFSAGAMDNLTGEAYDEIEARVREHIRSVEADRKNSRSGSSSS